MKWIFIVGVIRTYSTYFLYLNTKSKNRHSNERMSVFFDSGGGDRTHDLTGMNRTLSPAELRRQIKSTEIIIQQRNLSVNRFTKKEI